MNIQRLLPVNVAAMAALASLLLGMSQQSSSLPVIAVLAAATSLVFTDFLDWFRLNRSLANLCAVVAVGNTVIQSHASGIAGQFLSVANLLIYLQIILLFQHKTLRIYWQLIVLSLLQVVVAAALNLFFLFGALLILYLFVALSGLLLFFVYRETVPFLAPAVSGRLAQSGPHATIEVQGKPASAGVCYSPCAGDPRGSMVRRGLFRQVAWIAMSTLMITALVFFLMPRYTNAVWRSPSQRQTGFTPEVQLDEMGVILESPETALRVSLFDDQTGSPYRVDRELYIRGAVLMHYHRGGRWTRRGGGEWREERDLISRNPIGMVRQQFLLESHRTGVVFGVCPAYQLGSDDNAIQFDPQTRELLLLPDSYGAEGEPTQYVIGTTAFRNGLQSNYIPALMRPDGDPQHEATRLAQELPGLVRIAQQTLADSGLPVTDRLGRARALEVHFIQPGAYSYSLDTAPGRNRRVDPIEDFVTNHRSGHCEYFASALTLMLRSQGIPARMVVGFKGGIFNTVGAYHQFREMDAHAWVEAYLEPGQVPRDEVLPAERMELGAWVRLDPTPGPIRAAQRTRLSGWGSQLRDAMDYAQLMWSEYVLGLNERRQQRAIYDPLHTSWNAARAYLLDPRQWARRLRSFKQRFSADSLETLRGNWFNRQAAADALLLGIALIVLYVGLRWLAKMLKQLVRAAARDPRRKRRQPVDFYQKFERLLAQHGMARRASQTPREFAASASSRWADNPHLRHLASVPDVVVEAFYAVRFGNQRLDALDAQDLEQSLLRLQQGLVEVGSRKSEVGV